MIHQGKKKEKKIVLKTFLFDFFLVLFLMWGLMSSSKREQRTIGAFKKNKNKSVTKKGGLGVASSVHCIKSIKMTQTTLDWMRVSKSSPSDVPLTERR